MNQERIPVLAYAFIGITSLVLAYATFLDKTSDNESDNKSATSMLPDVFSKSPIPENAAIPAIISNPIKDVLQKPTDVENTESSNNDLEQKPAVGGKTKRRKKNRRNTKRKKR
jgi:hypothetical protein